MGCCRNLPLIRGADAAATAPNWTLSAYLCLNQLVYDIVATMRRMETPYGEIPDRFVRDMRPQEMHDFLRRRYGRRNLLKGAAALGVAAIAGPVLWRQSAALAATTPGRPQWIAFGADPRSEMYLSWSTGKSMGKVPTPKAPQVRWGLDSSYGSRQRAESAQVPIPSTLFGNPIQPVEHTFYNHSLLSGLTAGASSPISMAPSSSALIALATYLAP